MINSVLQNYSNRIATLEEIRKVMSTLQREMDLSHKCNQSFETLFGLKLAHLMHLNNFLLIFKLKILPYRRPHVEQIY